MSEDMGEEFAAEYQLYPAWKEAVDKFLAAGFERGALVPIEWFWSALSLEKPGPDTPLRIADKARVTFMDQFTAMNEALLCGHNIWLKNEWARGYRIVTPGEQSGLAEQVGGADIKRSLRKLGARLSFVDLTALSETQRRENADALARFAMLTGMVEQVKSERFIVKDDGV